MQVGRVRAEPGQKDAQAQFENWIDSIIRLKLSLIYFGLALPRW